MVSPHRMVNRAAEQEFVIQIDSVEVNPDLPKDRFDLPPEIKALLNKPAAAENKPAPAAIPIRRWRQTRHLHGGCAGGNRNLHPEEIRQRLRDRWLRLRQPGHNENRYRTI